MKRQPINWCLSWAGTVELGFADGKYLPREAAEVRLKELKGGEE